MLKQLLATTAFAIALGGVAQAQEADDATEPMIEQQSPAVEPLVPPADGSSTAEEPEVVQDGGALTTEPTTAPGAPAEVVADGEMPLPQLVPVDMADLTAGQLIKASLRDPDGAALGSVDDALLGEGGAIEALIVSFGGFLGFGEKTVEITLDEVELMLDEAGNVVAETAMTPETLEARPDYQTAPGA